MRNDTSRKLILVCHLGVNSQDTIILLPIQILFLELLTTFTKILILTQLYRKCFYN